MTTSSTAYGQQGAGSGGGDASAGLVIRVGVIVVSGQAQRGGIIAAETFVVRDANGFGRAQLSMTENEPALTLYDDSGRLRVAVVGERAKQRS